MAKIRDFSEFGKPEQFIFGGETYTIPAISQQTSKLLGKIAEVITEATDSQEFEAVAQLLFDYVACAMCVPTDVEINRADYSVKFIGHDEELYKKLEKLPKRVIQEVFSLISDMLGVPTTVEGEEQRKKAKK